jgi:hypothetical protein
MPYRDFDAERRDRLAQLEAVRFSLGGEEFTADPDPHPDVIIEIQDLWGKGGQEVEATGTMSMQTMAAMTRATRDAMVGLVMPEDAERMNAVLERKGTGQVGINSIMETLMWLVEVVNDRPTMPSSPSASSPDATVAPSTPASPSGQVSTLRPSASGD